VQILDIPNALLKLSYIIFYCHRASSQIRISVTVALFVPRILSPSDSYPVLCDVSEKSSWNSRQSFLRGEFIRNLRPLVLAA